jgi:hypothetical protein
MREWRRKTGMLEKKLRSGEGIILPLTDVRNVYFGVFISATQIQQLLLEIGRGSSNGLELTNNITAGRRLVERTATGLGCFAA